MTIGTDSSSRPSYGRLAWKPAHRHVIVSDESGLLAIEALLESDTMAAHAPIHVLLLGRESRISPASKLSGHGFSTDADEAGFSMRLGAILSDGPMASRLYAAGAESFLALVRRLARDSGFAQDATQEQLAGCGARHAQCAHCKTIYRDVVWRAFKCPRCEVLLIVRDHYSRRIGAFQAVVLHPADPNTPALRQERL